MDVHDGDARDATSAHVWSVGPRRLVGGRSIGVTEGPARSARVRGGTVRLVQPAGVHGGRGPGDRRNPTAGPDEPERVGGPFGPVDLGRDVAAVAAASAR